MHQIDQLRLSSRVRGALTRLGAINLELVCRHSILDLMRETNLDRADIGQLVRELARVGRELRPDDRPMKFDVTAIGLYELQLSMHSPLAHDDNDTLTVELVGEDRTTAKLDLLEGFRAAATECEPSERSRRLLHTAADLRRIAMELEHMAGEPVPAS